MSYSESARKRERRARSTLLVAWVVVTAVVIGLVGYQSLAPSSSSASPPGLLGHPAARGKAAGVVPDGVTVFDDQFPAVANLDPDLLDALREAATDAADDGVELVVNSGWRSWAYQERLLREAVAEHGSEEEAARWASTPQRSRHVTGDAVDIGPPEATPWLSEYGAAYGLCQIYDNEPWHFELRTEAIDDGCPPRYADPTQDPSM
jgi:zinc D-Ala-D-Ala carboxypeptidase